MSYDLTFWKQNRKSELSPEHIFHELLAGRPVDGLKTIQKIAFIGRLNQKFPGIIQEGGLVFWEGGERGMFEVYTSNQHVHICCRQLSDEDMNAIIDIAAEFECPLYDPQLDKRFDS